MGPIDKFAETIAKHVANGWYDCFAGRVKCLKCGRTFPSEKDLLESDAHDCVSKRKKE